MVILPFGCDVTFLIIVAACCFGIHSTSVVVVEACALVKSSFDSCKWILLAAQEITAQPFSRTHGQPRVTAFHPSVQ